ncbi:hypothetical protein [Pyrodictium abyssi]|uniref:Uncharacterized protein n=1 Tax=Pyrodictium abyssi TaxID=54256 RepID=A0ABM8ITQ8_9CREN|nr:hypothetical protein PABY_05180 [Pyrodictium abyssi]
MKVPGAGRAGPQSDVLEKALEDPEAAAHWLLVYMTYFRNIVATTARYLYRSVGLRAGMVQLGSIVEEAVERSFHVQRLSAQQRGMKLETVDDLFELNRACHHDAAERLSPLGLEVFRIDRDPEGRYYMETEQCSLFRALDEAPVLRVFPVALVSGLLRGLGYRSRWLTSVSEKERLCRSIASGSSRPYDYVVYLDESLEPPACRVVVEQLSCS